MSKKKALTHYQRAKKAASIAETISDITAYLSRGDLAWYLNPKNNAYIETRTCINDLKSTLRNFETYRKKLNALIIKFNEVA